VTISQLKVQADGKILLAGGFDTVDGDGARRLKRLNADGSPDKSFVSPELPGWQGVNALVLQPDGKILVAGWSTNGVVRLNSDGTLDSTFQLSYMTADIGLDGLENCGLQPDGKIVIFGQVNHIGSVNLDGVGRLFADGSVDPDFHPQISGAAYWFAPQPDGKCVIGGQFSAVDGVPRAGFARLNVDGSVDPSFVPAADQWGLYAVQSDGKVFTGGGIGLQRLNDDGSIDYDFNPGFGFAGGPWTISIVVVQRDNKAIVGGSFSYYDASPRTGLVRINLDGRADPQFNVNLGLVFENSNNPISVNAVDVQADGRIVIAGEFTSVNGVSRSWLARLFPDGQLDPSLNAFQPSLTPPTFPAPDEVWFKIFGERGRPYRVESSRDLTHWSTVRNFIISDDYFQFATPRLPAVPQLFYRVSSL
jgi:uncharacterized delta-60 repeat protein